MPYIASSTAPIYGIVRRPYNIAACAAPRNAGVHNTYVRHWNDMSTHEYPIYIYIYVSHTIHQCRVVYASMQIRTRRYISTVTKKHKQAHKYTHEHTHTHKKNTNTRTRAHSHTNAHAHAHAHARTDMHICM